MSWFFAYGSLLWDENSYLEYSDVERALLPGYHRNFNKKSVVAWGNSENPAPVLGLESGKYCVGRAYKLGSEEVLEMLEEREGPSYNLISDTVHLEGGGKVEAQFFKNKRNHTYIGGKPLGKRAEMSIAAEGEKGSGVEYVMNTRDELRRIGIEDPNIEEFASIIEDRLE